MNNHQHYSKPACVKIPADILRQIDHGFGHVVGVRGERSVTALTRFRRKLTIDKIAISLELDQALHELIVRAMIIERNENHE